MIKTLWLGDPHVTVSNLEESERLLDFVLEQAKKNEVNKIIILGDLYNTFALKRIEVDYFWSKWSKLLSAPFEVIVLVGNHDKVNQSNDKDERNALDIICINYTKNLIIVSSPYMDKDNFGYLPYIHDKNIFIKQANQLAEGGAKALICHAEFSGGQFDSGMYIPDGINPDDINIPLIISGHVHSRQFFGKVRYPGTARWLSSSDANKEKGLWLTMHDEQTGAIIAEKFIDTSSVCIPIYKIQYKEGEEEPEIKENSRTALELIGSSEWILKQKANFKGKASISCKMTDKSKTKNRKTGNNLNYFINNIFQVTSGIDKEKMLSFMKEIKLI